MTYTEDEVNELKLCKEDIVYFAEKYIKTDFVGSTELIKLYQKQKEILYAWVNDSHHVTLSSHQSGASTLYAIFLLHLSLFNTDKSSIMCCHRYDNCIIMRELIISMYDNLPKFIKSELITNSKEKIYFINGSRIIFISVRDQEPLRGHSVNTIILDNIDYAPAEKVDNLWQSIVPCLKFSPSSKLIIGGTPANPNGKQWELSKTKGWNTSIITYKDVPHHNTPEWEKAMRDIAGDEAFNTEFALEYAT
jgi:hypothetical protein